MESIKIYELYDFWYQPFWEYIIIGVLAIFFIGVCAGLIFWIWRKKRKQRKVEPWTQALVSLEKLKPSDYEGYEGCKEYYTLLTSILKKYFSAQYSLNLTNKTDFECIKILKPYLYSSSALEKLEVIMSGATWAKFAPEGIMQKKMAEHREDGIVILKSTKGNPPLDMSGKLGK